MLAERIIFLPLAMGSWVAKKACMVKITGTKETTKEIIPTFAAFAAGTPLVRSRL